MEEIGNHRFIMGVLSYQYAYATHTRIALLQQSPDGAKRRTNNDGPCSNIVISKRVKVRLYESFVVSVLVCGSECWC